MQKWTKLPSQTIQIGVLLFDQFSNLCLANCLEPLRAANMFSRTPVYRWDLMTLSGNAVETSSGIPVLPTTKILQNGTWDYLCILTSYGYLAHDTPKTRHALRHISRRAKMVIGFDTAPWLMAAAGLLNGRRATLHWEALDLFAETFLTLEVERHAMVRDGNRITCAGALAALDLMLDLIAEHLGQGMRLDIAQLFLQPDAPLRDRPGKSAINDNLIRRALQIMQDTLETPLSLQRLAEALAYPSKSLQRRFQLALSAPPGKVYRHLRLSKAAQLVDSTRMPISEIALRCGYDNPSAFTRAFKDRYGWAPRDQRRSGQITLDLRPQRY